MTRSFISARLVSVAALAVLGAASAITLPTAASAGGCPTCGAAQNVGLIKLGMGVATLGVMAAGAATAHSAPAYGGPVYGGGCYVTRQQVTDEFGDVYVRRVRVCE